MAADSATNKPTRVPPAPAFAAAAPAAKTGRYDFDIIVIGGGPAGYAAAIRAGQLKKRVLCIEKENLGGTCLNWGCIPTKALLEDGAFVRKLRTEADSRGVSFSNLQVDFAKIVGRSRAVAEKLKKGVGFLFSKYEVKHELAQGQLLGPNRVRYTNAAGAKEVTGENIILASGAKAMPLPGVEFDGSKIITSREAMNLKSQPKKLAIIGAGAIGCEFADFYNAIGTEVTLIEMLPNLLPNEDEDVALVLEAVWPARIQGLHQDQDGQSRKDQGRRRGMGSPACLVQPVLLPLHHAGVAGEEAHRAEARLPVRLLCDDRAGEAEAHGAGLGVNTAAGDDDRNIIAIKLELIDRGTRVLHQAREREILRRRLAVDRHLAGAARCDAHARDRGLPAADGLGVAMALRRRRAYARARCCRTSCRPMRCRALPPPLRFFFQFFRCCHSMLFRFCRLARFRR